jgi:DNA-binding winged helix-turn-helix (wHTH) protein/tetratricopeptide (TPR) repeat protein
MTADLYQFGEFRFVPQARELWRAGRRVTLPRRTFECLQYLIEHRDRAVHRDELVEALFGRPNVSDAQLGQIVLRTRRVLDDDGNAQRVIRTIPGYGYRWVAEIDAIDVAAGDGKPDPAIEAVTSPVSTPAMPEARAGFGAAVVRTRHSHARWWPFAVVLAFGALVVGVLTLAPSWRPVSETDEPAPSPSPSPAARAVVMPLRVDGLREDAWVRLGAMDLVAERLRTAGLGVPSSETVLSLLHVAGDAAGSADAAHVRATLDVPLIVQGRAIRDAAGWTVELAASPEHGIAVPVRFSAPDAVQAARGASDLLLAALGRTVPAERERDGALDETLQRARAAMLANELDTARSILSASTELAAAPDQLVYRLAQVDFRAGRLDAVEHALDQLLTGSQTQADSHFRAQVLIARGATRTRRGAFAEGGRDFDAALAALGADGDTLERGKARLGRANSRVAEHRYAEALGDFGAARVDLESAGDVLGVARVDANLGMLELYRGRPAAALGYLPGAADRFQAVGALHELLLTLTGLIEAQLAMLQRDAAWTTVERASALRERITDPDQRVDLLLNRAQVFAGVGRYREAQAALSQASGTATSGNRVLLARLRALEADLSVREGNWRSADAATAAALADWPAAGADGDRAAVVLLRQRALLALGHVAFARALLDRSRAVPAEAGEEPGRVAEALAMAEWAMRERDDARAAAWFGFAAATAERRGVPAEIVAVAMAQAPRLLAADAREEAAAVIGRVAPWAAHDFDCALLQLRLYHALGQRDAWFNALRQAQTLAGEREIPSELLRFTAG